MRLSQRQIWILSGPVLVFDLIKEMMSTHPKKEMMSSSAKVPPGQGKE